MDAIRVGEEDVDPSIQSVLSSFRYSRSFSFRANTR